MEEEREQEAAEDAPVSTDALAARTRALVEESKALLRRLERLLERERADEDDAEATGDGDHERS